MYGGDSSSLARRVFVAYSLAGREEAMNGLLDYGQMWDKNPDALWRARWENAVREAVNASDQ